VPASQPDDLSRIKIFPRNLTARADYAVRGNPPTSRPESGVDNCFPGLEFDQRNLDQAFFPGLRFEFHRGDGAILVAIEAGSEPERAGLREDDLRPPLYLWALIAPRAAGETADNQPVFFHDQNGLQVWRRVHDLMPGRLAILLVPQPGVAAPRSTRASPHSWPAPATRTRVTSGATGPGWPSPSSSATAPATSTTTVLLILLPTLPVT
jgi:hypothetical protein